MEEIKIAFAPHLNERFISSYFNYVKNDEFQKKSQSIAYRSEVRQVIFVDMGILKYLILRNLTDLCIDIAVSHGLSVEHVNRETGN